MERGSLLKARAGGKLHGGNHGIAPDEVVAAQRARMLVGMIEAAARKGYAAVTVADVLERAGVSRMTFYQHFANKEACFLAAYDMAVEIVMTRIGTALTTDGPALERIDRALEAYLSTLAQEPEVAKVFLVEVYAAGTAVLQRRLATQSGLVDGFAAAFGANLPDQRVVAEAVIGAVVALATNRIVAGDFGGLPDLREPLMSQLITKLVRADPAVR
ncbi:TetR/AcrR family transcriptional regulator [Nocardia amamiensis]|uniref:TetR/AcrR family transcriptional regulator n=1 Tax=Nocardia amamiensis TaxID=404578 RepID=A0ABS0CW15_9NOCA|nr:TetR/AcrR family transcriptional regulator [Nocardia amamiensis]MBF6300804.1 TetR/AcrR family transcriptional regulator [Nocardia amamiensis]